MLTTMELYPGITLRCFCDNRFKQGALSLQLVRPMGEDEAALNALLPSVLLRGCREYPDLRRITQRLDELYGASIGPLVRRVGDYQTTGLYCGFMEDRFALPGDAVFAPMCQLMRQLLFDPVLEDGVFAQQFVEGEKTNLIATLESQLNDKRAYAMERMLRKMCAGDSFGIPRLGNKEQVESITPAQLYAQYRNVLRESPVHIFYVGSAPADTVAQQLKPLFAGTERSYVNLKSQTGLSPAPGGEYTEEMEVNQGKLCMGFVTPVTLRSEQFAAMQVMNMVFGGGMMSKLFMNVREKMSLCYDIGSGYHSAKGILTVSAGIDCSNVQIVRDEIMGQLEACRSGDITEAELRSAKESLCSSLRATHDSPGAIENYYATAALSGLGMTPAQYHAAVEAVTPEQVMETARTLNLHTVFLLKGVHQ